MTRIRNDILTLRRQLEISENDYKKSFTIFFLKNIFIYLLFCLLVALLVKNQNIKSSYGFIAIGVLTAIIVLVIVFNLYLNRNRNTNIFDKQDCVKPTLEETTDSTNASSSFKFGISVKAGAGTDSKK